MTNSPPGLNLIQRAVQFEAGLRPDDAPSAFIEARAAGEGPPGGMPQAPGVDVERLGGNGDEIRDRRGTQTVLEFNHGRCRDENILLPGNAEFETRNEFRTIKRRLLAAMAGGAPADGPPTILVTSALPGEGKTFTSINLALTLADERDLHILLIEGDAVNPSLSKYFATGRAREGLVELLNEKVPSGDVVYQCAGIPNLSVLFAGHADPRASELMASPRFPELLAEMHRNYRNLIVVIDCSPVISPEPAALARHVTHALVIVAAEQSSRSEVQETLNQISAAPQISLIFNKSPRWRKKNSYYHYGYRGPNEQEPNLDVGTG